MLSRVHGGNVVVLHARRRGMDDYKYKESGRRTLKPVCMYVWDGRTGKGS